MRSILILLSAFLLLGKSKSNIMEVDMAFDEHSLLLSLNTHLISSVPTSTSQTTTLINSNDINTKTMMTNQYSFSPLITITPTTEPQELTKTVMKTVKKTVTAEPSSGNEKSKPSKKKRKKAEKNGNKKKSKKKLKRKKKKNHIKKSKESEIEEITEVIKISTVTPTVTVEIKETSNEDFDANDIWRQLEEASKPKLERPKIKKALKEAKKTKSKFKNVSKEAKKEDEKALREQEEEAKEEVEENEEEKEEEIKPKRRIHKTKLKRHVKKELAEVLSSTSEEEKICIEKVEKGRKERIPKRPTKVQKNSCIHNQTIVIPDDRVKITSFPLPTVTDWISTAKSFGPNIIDEKKTKTVYNCITNYDGTATVTKTVASFVPIERTDWKQVTTTAYAPTTKIITEVLYTPYTVTTTSTDTMYMVKVTTVAKGHAEGCKACELDSNGLVIPAGQLPPGLFATPIAEVDRSKFDIVGYAGFNPPNFNANFQGFANPPNIPV